MDRAVVRYRSGQARKNICFNYCFLGDQQSPIFSYERRFWSTWTPFTDKMKPQTLGKEVSKNNKESHQAVRDSAL